MNTLELLYNKALMKAAADQDEQVKKGKVWFTILKYLYILLLSTQPPHIPPSAFPMQLYFYQMLISSWIWVFHYISYFNIWVTENLNPKDSNSTLNSPTKKASPSKTPNLSLSTTSMAAGKINTATTTTPMVNLPINPETHPSPHLKAVLRKTTPTMSMISSLGAMFMRRIMRKNISNIWKQSIMRRFRKITINWWHTQH